MAASAKKFTVPLVGGAITLAATAVYKEAVLHIVAAWAVEYWKYAALCILSILAGSFLGGRKKSVSEAGESSSPAMKKDGRKTSESPLVQISKNVEIDRPQEFILQNALEQHIGPFDLNAANSLGIRGCVPRLEGTEWSPEQCRKKTLQRLRFSGVQGRKWIEQGEPYREFEQFLKRLGRRRPEHKPDVRFLLLDPTCEGYPTIADKYGIERGPDEERRMLEGLEGFLALKNKYNFFDVHFFDHDPYFRIVVIDEKEAYVAPYRPKEKRGASAPHLIFRSDEEPEAPDAWSLYTPFVKHFEDVWELRSKTLETTIERLRLNQGAPRSTNQSTAGGEVKRKGTGSQGRT
jgi:hypothetical protein